MPDERFELGLGFRFAPVGHAHGDERHGAHQRGDDEHAERDILDRADGADRGEALADDDHDETE